MRTLSRARLAARRSLERAAFTLVEVLVVVLIISGIMLAVTQVLDSARVSRDTIHNIEETQLAGPAIMDLIERDLRALITYDLPIESMLRVKNRVVSGLDADSIDFVTTTDSLSPWDVDRRAATNDYGEVGYRLRPNPEDKDLLEIYRRESFGVDEKPFEGGQFVFLHDRVRHFDVQIYTEDGPDADPIEEWGDSQTEPDKMGLPARLEIELTLELAPRIQREQVIFKAADKRTISYRRVIRLPQGLRDALASPPIPEIPKLTAADPSAAPGGGTKSGASSLDGGKDGKSSKGTQSGVQGSSSSGERPAGGASVIKG